MGHWVDDQLSWDIHTNKLVNKLNSANFALSKVKTKFPFKARLNIYNALIHSNLMWGSLVTGATSAKNVNKIGGIQNKTIRNLCNVKYNSHTALLYYNHRILKFFDIIKYIQLLFAHKQRIGALPNIFNRLIQFSYESGDRQNRDSVFNFHVPKIDSSKQRFPLIELIRTWNTEPIWAKFIWDTLEFKKDVKACLLEKYKDIICSKNNCFSCKVTHDSLNRKGPLSRT